jgi:hypothetical protein
MNMLPRKINKFVVILAASTAMPIVQADTILVSQHYAFSNEHAAAWFYYGDTPYIRDDHNYVTGGLTDGAITLNEEVRGWTSEQQVGIVFQTDPNGGPRLWDVNIQGSAPFYNTWTSNWTFTLEDLSKEQSWIDQGVADNSANLVSDGLGPSLINNDHFEVTLEPGDLYFAYLDLYFGGTGMDAHVQIQPHFVPENAWTAGLFLGVLGLLVIPKRIFAH